jgi:prepilin-type N-terminal cleavage/methylation domain-containing protein
MHAQPHTHSGVTLIEVIFVVALVGVLVAIVVPSYGNYNRRAMAAEGLSLAQPTMIKVREEVIYQDYTPGTTTSPGGGFLVPPVVPDLSTMVKSIERHDLNVIINYTTQFDPEGRTEYSMVMAGTIVNDTVTWQCKSGPAAATDLAAASAQNVTVGVPLPTRWAPSGC